MQVDQVAYHSFHLWDNSEKSGNSWLMSSKELSSEGGVNWSWVPGWLRRRKRDWRVVGGLEEGTFLSLFCVYILKQETDPGTTGHIDYTWSFYGVVL